jgi:hypothetical protein
MIVRIAGSPVAPPSQNGTTGSHSPIPGLRRAFAWSRAAWGGEPVERKDSATVVGASCERVGEPVTALAARARAGGPRASAAPGRRYDRRWRRFIGRRLAAPHQQEYPMSKQSTLVGLDVHADTIAVVVVLGREVVRSLGIVPNTPEALRRILGKLGPKKDLRVCYKAGPTGYVIHWELMAMGIRCDVVAPSLVPAKPGDRINTDRRGATRWRSQQRPRRLLSQPHRIALKLVRVGSVACTHRIAPGRVNEDGGGSSSRSERPTVIVRCNAQLACRSRTFASPGSSHINARSRGQGLEAPQLRHRGDSRNRSRDRIYFWCAHEICD